MDNNKPIILGCVYSNPKDIFLSGRGCVYSSDGISPTILTMSGGNKPFVVVKRNREFEQQDRVAYK